MQTHDPRVWSDIDYYLCLTQHKDNILRPSAQFMESLAMMSKWGNMQGVDKIFTKAVRLMTLQIHKAISPTKGTLWTIMAAAPAQGAPVPNERYNEPMHNIYHLDAIQQNNAVPFTNNNNFDILWKHLDAAPAAAAQVTNETLNLAPAAQKFGE